MPHPNEVTDEAGYEYGFEDSANPGTVWWYTFGGLINFSNMEEVRHTASKSILGDAIYWRRRAGEDAELVPEDQL